MEKLQRGVIKQNGEKYNDSALLTKWTAGFGPLCLVLRKKQFCLTNRQTSVFVLKNEPWRPFCFHGSANWIVASLQLEPPECALNLQEMHE